jgi:peroxiredoxin
MTLSPGITGIPSTSLFAALAAVAVARAQEPPTAPDATFQGQSGNVSLKDFRGKQAVVLLFMRGYSEGRTCFYCGEQTREYAASYKEFTAAGAEVLMVLPLAKDIAGYMRKIGETGEPPDPKLALPFRVVLDGDGSACKAFHVPLKAVSSIDPFPVSSPATIVIGKDGRILFEHHGADPGDRPEAAKVLEVLRTGKAEPAGAKRTVSPPPPSREWSGYEAGMAAAKARSRPILLEFHAVW